MKKKEKELRKKQCKILGRKPDISWMTEKQADEIITNYEKTYKMRYSSIAIADVSFLLCLIVLIICAIGMLIATLNNFLNAGC